MSYEYRRCLQLYWCSPDITLASLVLNYHSGCNLINTLRSDHWLMQTINTLFHKTVIPIPSVKKWWHNIFEQTLLWLQISILDTRCNQSSMLLTSYWHCTHTLFISLRWYWWVLRKNAVDQCNYCLIYWCMSHLFGIDNIYIKLKFNLLQILIWKDSVGMGLPSTSYQANWWSKRIQKAIKVEPILLPNKLFTMVNANKTLYILEYV